MTINEQYNAVCELTTGIEAEPASDFKDQKLDYLYNIKKIIELEADNKGIKL